MEHENGLLSEENVTSIVPENNLQSEQIQDEPASNEQREVLADHFETSIIAEETAEIEAEVQAETEPFISEQEDISPETEPPTETHRELPCETRKDSCENNGAVENSGTLNNEPSERPNYPYSAPVQSYGVPNQPYGVPNGTYPISNSPYGTANNPYGNPYNPYGAPSNTYSGYQQPFYGGVPNGGYGNGNYFPTGYTMPTKKKNPKPVIGLIMSLIALGILNFFPVIALVCGIVAMCLSYIGLRKDEVTTGQKICGLIGLGVGIFTLIISVAMLVMLLSMYMQVMK